MAYGDGYKELPVQGSVEFCMMQLLVAFPVLDILDSSKTWPRIVIAVIIVMLATPEGQFVGLGLLQKLMAFGPVWRNRIHVALWVLTGSWCWFGRWKRSSPIWIVYVMLMGYAILGCLAPSNRASVIVEVPDLLSVGECSQIIAIAEELGSHEGWTTARHGNLSTEDIPVPDLSILNETLQRVLLDRLAPVTRQYFGGVLIPADAFVVRYSEGRQTKLREHTDAGQATYSVVLSDEEDYQGGGVKFPLLPSEDEPLMAGIELDDSQRGRVVRAPRGHVLLHGSKVRHEGMEVVGGTRYLLISFNKVHYESWWHMLFNFHGSVAKENELVVLPSSQLGKRTWPELSSTPL